MQDAKRSAAAFHELDALLGMIIALREANGGTGPDERETNLKLVYEQAVHGAHAAAVFLDEGSEG
ncbi:unnamed protein product [Symbiodinium microadriaticum]|nr:unnamed protein product [Symbiodinium microadriaticum]